MIYIREDITSKSLNISPISNEIEIESIFIEINLRNRKWLLGGTYIPHKILAPLHLQKIGNTQDLYLEKYDNILLMGDYNCEVVEQAMHVFCETYNLKNLIKVPTCFKNPDNPSCIDLILTNKPRIFLILELLKQVCQTTIKCVLL